MKACRWRHRQSRFRSDVGILLRCACEKRSGWRNVSRVVHIAAAQLGPIEANCDRSEVVDRLLALMRQASAWGCDLVVYPELALTTFFPRWYTDDPAGHDRYFETEMPSAVTKVLFDEARRLAVGFCLGYAELTPSGERFNSYLLVDREGRQIGKYRKVHIPGHDQHESWRPFQHLERRYFQESNEGFPVFEAFGGVVGMALCNDRRWPETYRVLALQSAEIILIGYNTPLHYAPDPDQNALQAFHNQLVMQAGAYQNGSWVVGVAKGGIEAGVESLSQSVIIGPSGQIVAQTITSGDVLISAHCDLDLCSRYKDTLFDFERYRRPECYELITSQKGAIRPSKGGPQ
jgi:Predicted amidohydrolase